MSSKRAIRRKSCTGKDRHPDKRSAERVRRSVAKAHLSITSSYKCRWCGHWHWGHTPIAFRKGAR